MHTIFNSLQASYLVKVDLMQINGNFGFHIPVVVNVPEGIIGRDSLTDEFREVISDDHGNFQMITSRKQASN